MEYHKIGERFEYDGVVLEVMDGDELLDTCTFCYFEKLKCGTLNCCSDERYDGKDAYFKLVEKCKTKDMEQGVEIRCEGRDEVFAYTAKENPKLEDLKDGDFVAFDYNGNTAVTKLVSDKGDFMYAVGLWHDSNLVGKEDAIWYADNINDVNSVEPITNLHYASVSEVMRYMRVISEDWEREKRRLLKDEVKTLFECQTTEDYIGNLTDSLRKTLVAKDHDYNSAFSEMFDELGIDYAYGKLREKMNRIKTLRNQPNMVENEGLEDALLDTAGYAILTLVELKKRKQ